MRAMAYSHGRAAFRRRMHRAAIYMGTLLHSTMNTLCHARRPEQVVLPAGGARCWTVRDRESRTLGNALLADALAFYTRDVFPAPVRGKGRDATTPAGPQAQALCSPRPASQPPAKKSPPP